MGLDTFVLSNDNENKKHSTAESTEIGKRVSILNSNVTKAIWSEFLPNDKFYNINTISIE